MAPSVANLTAGGPQSAGGVLSGTPDAVLPTDARTAFDPISWNELGLVGEDGLAPGGERTIEDIRDWNGDIVASLQSEHSSTFTFTLLEVFNEGVLKAVFGDANVSVTAATPEAGKLYTVVEDGRQLERKPFGFDMRHIDKRIRLVVPTGKITTVEEQPFTVGGLNAFACTVTAFKDAAGNKVYRYYDDGNTVAA